MSRFLQELSTVQLTLPVVSIFFVIISLCILCIPVRFVRTIGCIILDVSLVVTLASAIYLEFYHLEWESEHYPDARYYTDSSLLYEVNGIDSSGVYVVDSGDDYIVMKRRSGMFRIVYECYYPVRLSKSITTIRYDAKGSIPHCRTYQSGRKYYCPHPKLLQFLLLQFDEPCNYVIRKDPKAEKLYEIVLSDPSMLATLSPGS